VIVWGTKKCAAKKEAEKLIRDLDSNGDRSVDLDEFMEAIIECGSKEVELMDAFLKKYL
jgi:Ca2+-binding EF-hand superfamily protein